MAAEHQIEHRTDRRGGDRRAGVLHALGERVAPVSMAHERTMPVPNGFESLFAEGAMVRGRVLSCAGAAATSLALALLAPAIEAGAWLAVVDVPALGLDAASELGVPLERVVGVELGERPGEVWPEVVAAAADGFDLVLTRAPADVRPAAARSVVARLQQRGVIVMLLGDPGPIPCDGVLESSSVAWEGVGDGFGHLCRRTVVVEASGRRLPGARRATVGLPAGTEAGAANGTEAGTATGTEAGTVSAALELAG